MTKKTKILGIGLISISLFAILGGIFTSASLKDSLTKATSGAYSCGSIKFGYKDGEQTALDYSISAKIDGDMVKDSTYSTDIAGVTVSGDATVYGRADTKVPIKFGNSGGAGTLTITFSSNTVIGCTVYALGYNKDNSFIKVNEAEAQEVSNSVSSSDNYDFDPYFFELTETNTIKITCVKGITKSFRFFVANISFRLR